MTTRNTTGICRTTSNGVEWYPFGYHEPRLAKPGPCFTSDCPRLHAIAAELGPDWQVRDATKAERNNVRIAEVGEPGYGVPVSVLDGPRAENRDSDLHDENNLLQS